MDRVAISVLRDYEGLCASMDERFGRAKAFLVVDGKTGKTIETIDNAPADPSHGACTAAAGLLSSAGVQAVVSGRFGPDALEVLQDRGIQAWIAPSGINAGEALLMLVGGRLERLESSAHGSGSQPARGTGRRISSPLGQERTGRQG